MNQEMLEILIGRYLDSEITPAEQRLLDKQLRENPDAQQMLDQLQQLQDEVREVLSDEFVDRGESAGAIFDRAWHKSKGRPEQSFRMPGWVRFAAGIAAGFVLGLGVYFAMSQLSPDKTEPAAPVEIAKNDDTLQRLPVRIKRVIRPKMAPGPTRRVDWYNYADERGDQWLVETYRENAVTTAAYHGDI